MLDDFGYIPDAVVSVDPVKEKVSPFDFVRSITETKQNIMEGNESSYNQFIINKALSFHVDCVFYVHEIQLAGAVTDEVHYQFLLNSIDKKKRYGSWVKKDSIPADVDLIKEAFGYSTKDAMTALELLSDKQLLELKDKLKKGGRR
jgi:hypothetical protein